MHSPLMVQKSASSMRYRTSKKLLGSGQKVRFRHQEVSHHPEARLHRWHPYSFARGGDLARCCPLGEWFWQSELTCGKDPWGFIAGSVPVPA